MGNSGVYALWLYLPKKTTIKVGKLGVFTFEAGVYAYLGSAQRNLKERVARHSRLEKKLHWHIDYFRAEAYFLGAVVFFDQPKAKECWLVQELLRIPATSFPIPGFGSSDCRCGAHLVHVSLATPRAKSV